MNYLQPVIDLIKALFAAMGLWFVRKSGKDAVKADNAAAELESINEANRTEDRLKSDPAYRDRVRDRFNG